MTYKIKYNLKIKLNNKKVLTKSDITDMILSKLINKLIISKERGVYRYKK